MIDQQTLGPFGQLRQVSDHLYYGLNTAFWHTALDSLEKWRKTVHMATLKRVRQRRGRKE